MDTFSTKILLSLSIIIGLSLIRLFTHRSINRSLKRFQFTIQRRRITVKLIDSFLILTSILGIIGIWGIESEKLVLFISSILTVLGIAFFAQWSLLSNITAGLILFFNHPLKIGDYISILEKDFIIAGKIDDITIFFLHIQTDNGEQITIPNSIVLQKNISIKQNIKD